MLLSGIFQKKKKKKTAVKLEHAKPSVNMGRIGIRKSVTKIVCLDTGFEKILYTR